MSPAPTSRSSRPREAEHLIARRDQALSASHEPMKPSTPVMNERIAGSTAKDDGLAVFEAAYTALTICMAARPSWPFPSGWRFSAMARANSSHSDFHETVAAAVLDGLVAEGAGRVVLADDELFDAVAGAETAHGERALVAEDFELEEVGPLGEARVDARDDAPFAVCRSAKPLSSSGCDRPAGGAREPGHAAGSARGTRRKDRRRGCPAP